jgi:broad specificity phosphatase PhoE
MHVNSVLLAQYNRHQDKPDSPFPGLRFSSVPGVKKVVFIRHGESSANFSRQCVKDHGPEFEHWDRDLPLGDPPLTDVGVRQAREVGRLIGEHFERERAAAGNAAAFPSDMLENALVFVSPMRRTIETARNVFEVGVNQVYKKSGQPPRKTQMIDRLLPAAREYFHRAFALGSHPDVVENKYLNRAEFGGALTREDIATQVSDFLTDRLGRDSTQGLEFATKNEKKARSDLQSIRQASSEELEVAQALERYSQQLRKKTDGIQYCTTMWGEEHGFSGPAARGSWWSAEEDRAEWGRVYDSIEHVNDPSRMDELNSEILRALGLAGHRVAGGVSIDGGSEESKRPGEGLPADRAVDTVYVVCHWGTIINYCNRFCDNLQKQGRVTDMQWMEGEKGWEKIDEIDIFDLDNCGVKVVEFRCDDGSDGGAERTGAAISAKL